MKKICITLILIIIAGILSGCTIKPVTSVSGNGFYFDTFVSFTVYGTEDTEIINGLKAECEKYEKIFSAVDQRSELYHLNKGDTDEVSGDLYESVKKALLLCEYSDGLYDITIRPVSEQWQFVREEPGGPVLTIIPDDENIKKALEKVDYRKVKLSETEDGKYKIDLNGTAIDMGSVAKGYIADRLIEYLKGKGIKSAIISLGGNIVCLGDKPVENDGKVEEQDYTVAIKSPFAAKTSTNDDGSGQYADIVYIRDKSVVTSGIYERSFEKDGITYHHLIDTKTGYPCNSDLASVSIISDSSCEADILSTVCYYLDYDKTIELQNKDIVGDFEAEFIYKDGSVKRTMGFSKYEHKGED